MLQIMYFHRGLILNPAYDRIWTETPHNHETRQFWHFRPENQLKQSVCKYRPATHSAEHTARGSGASECISASRIICRERAVDNLCRKVRRVLIADITFNRAGGGARAVMGTLHRKSGDRQLWLRPLMAIYALSRKSWKSFGCRYISINQTHNGAGSNGGPVKYSSQITSMQIYYYYLGDQRVALPSLCARPLFVAAPLVCNYSCSHIRHSHTIVLQFSAARARTLQHKARASLFTGRKRTVYPGN
jgi:hypothetical protein